MGDDCIERFHQVRVHDESGLIPLQNEGVMKRTQAKMQHTWMIHGVQQIKDLVNGLSKRKRKPNQESLGEQREAVKKVRREEIGNTAIASVLTQDPNEIFLPQRDLIKNELEKKEAEINATSVSTRS